MNDLKRMIFEYINNNRITDEEMQKLLFAIAKETANSKNINRLVWLYLNNERETFKTILEDALQQAILFYLEKQETAYKKTMSYIYKQYVSPRLYNAPLEHYEAELSIEIDKKQVQASFTQYNIKLDTKEKQQYYKSLIIQADGNLQKSQRVFANGRQKKQAINKLKELQII